MDRKRIKPACWKKKLFAGALVLSVIITAIPGTFVKAMTDEETRTLQNPRIIQDSSIWESGQKVTWDCIWFGMYPQSEVTSDNPVYEELQNSEEWDDNSDCVIDGVKYRRMQKKDAVCEGTFQWENDTIYHYFRYEPIKWRVLKTDGEQAMLLADEILDNQPFHTEPESAQWSQCTLRSWLNGYDASCNIQNTDYSTNNFIDCAFTESEQKCIVETKLSNKKDSSDPNLDGIDMLDMVYLLSENELCSETYCKDYGFIDDPDIGDEARVAVCSGYARINGVYYYSFYKKDGVEPEGMWLTRTLGESEYRDRVTVVFPSGSIYTEGQFFDDACGVRPVINLDLSNTEMYSYAGEVSSDGTVSDGKTPSASEESDATKGPDTTMTSDVPVSSTEPDEGFEDGSRIKYNGHVYQRYEDEMDWNEAKTYCESLGGHLVTVTSQGEQDAVEKILVNGKFEAYWMGAYVKNKQWYWITGEEFEYQNWSPNEPNDEDEDMCMQMFYDYKGTLNYIGKWDDSYIDGDRYRGGIREQGFICEWDSSEPGKSELPDNPLSSTSPRVSTGPQTSTNPAASTRPGGTSAPVKTPNPENSNIVLNNPRAKKDLSAAAKRLCSWDCLYFGEYPQSEVTFYDSEYKALQNAQGWDSNGGIVIDGVKYCRLAQDSEETPYKYYKYEPIKWRVLSTDGSKALLLADTVLDVKQYNETTEPYYSLEGETLWEVSSLRNWLNGYGKKYASDNFINTAFSEKEQERILVTKLDNEDKGNDTDDKIFLVTSDDLCNAAYGFAENDKLSRQAGKSDYSDKAESDPTRWWTRLNKVGVNMRLVDEDGDVDNSRDHMVSVGHENYPCWDYGIRPAIMLDLSDKTFYSYAGKVCSDGTDREVGVTGDADGDFKVTLADAQKALKVALRIDTVSDEYYDLIDIDCNENVTLSDAQEILKYALKLISEFK